MKIKYKKHINKILASVILLNNLTTFSNARELSSDTRYEIFEGNNIKITDILEEDEVDVEVEGSTIVNLNKKSNYKIHSSIYKKWEIGDSLKPSTTYSIVTNLTNEYLICVGYTNKVYMQYKDSSNINVFTTPDTLLEGNTGEICSIWVINNSRTDIDDSTLVNSEIMLLEGDWTSKKIPEYFEGMKSVCELNDNKIEIVSSNFNNMLLDKKEILLDAPLRGLKYGVKDKIVKINEKWYVERNCVQITLNENYNWAFNNIEGTVTNRYILDLRPIFSDLSKGQTVQNTFCDKLKTHQWSQTSENGISRTDGSLFVYKKECSTIGEFRDWIAKNNLNIIMKLETPIYKPLNVNSVLNTYLDMTRITNNSTIPANMKVTIDRAMNRAVEAIELAKTNSTVANISQARMWANLLKESVKKDELQNEINTIVDIEDLVLEKKSVTANLDVYVKSENALSMSLSTSSVTFEGYSGIDDLEKLNAVDVVISSSLPYDLNAYLEETLQNRDKSSTISPTAINIKENSNTDYKQFVNTTDKVVLKSDCDANNDVNHSIDLKLTSGNAHKADIYKAVIKFEAVQK